MIGDSWSQSATFAVFVVALACGSSTWAASAYVEQIEKQGAILDQPATSTTKKMWLTDEMVCIQNVDKGVVLVVRGETITIVQMAEQARTEMTMEQFKDLTDTASATIEKMGSEHEVKAEFKKTKEKAKVGKWNTRKFILRLTGPVPLEVSLWYTKDLGVDLTDWPALIQLLPGHDVLGEAKKQLTALSGYPVKRESTVTLQGQEITQSTEVTRFEQGEVDVPDFCGLPKEASPPLR